MTLLNAPFDDGKQFADVLPFRCSAEGPTKGVAVRSKGFETIAQICSLAHDVHLAGPGWPFVNAEHPRIRQLKIVSRMWGRDDATHRGLLVLSTTDSIAAKSFRRSFQRLLATDDAEVQRRGLLVLGDMVGLYLNQCEDRLVDLDITADSDPKSFELFGWRYTATLSCCVGIVDALLLLDSLQQSPANSNIGFCTLSVREVLNEFSLSSETDTTL